MQRHAIRLSVSFVTFLLGIAAATIPHLFETGTATELRYEREVLRANQEYLDAHVNRDVAALDRLLADDFVIRRGTGRAAGKAQRLALVSNPDASFVSVNCRNLRVYATEGEGEVTGRGVLTFRHMGREYTSPPYWFSRRFERRDGRWQLTAVRVSRDEWQ